jgi:hypothetical protein
MGMGSVVKGGIPASLSRCIVKKAPAEGILRYFLSISGEAQPMSSLQTPVRVDICFSIAKCFIHLAGY